MLGSSQEKKFGRDKYGELRRMVVWGTDWVGDRFQVPNFSRMPVLRDDAMRTTKTLLQSTIILLPPLLFTSRALSPITIPA